MGRCPRHYHLEDCYLQPPWRGHAFSTNAAATSESLLDRLLMSFLSSIVPLTFTALSLAHSDLNTGPLYRYNYSLLIGRIRRVANLHWTVRCETPCVSRGLPLYIQRFHSVLQLQATLAKDALIDLGRSSVVVRAGECPLPFRPFQRRRMAESSAFPTNASVSPYITNFAAV